MITNASKTQILGILCHVVYIKSSDVLIYRSIQEAVGKETLLSEALSQFPGWQMVVLIRFSLSYH